MRLDPDKIYKGIIAFQCFVALISLATFVAIVWVAWHFISKYW